MTQSTLVCIFLTFFWEVSAELLNGDGAMQETKLPPFFPHRVIPIPAHPFVNMTIYSDYKIEDIQRGSRGGQLYVLRTSAGSGGERFKVLLPRASFNSSSLRQRPLLRNSQNDHQQRQYYLQRTSDQARRYQRKYLLSPPSNQSSQICASAINGGPFHWDASPVGAVLIDGKWASQDFGPNVGLGRTKRIIKKGSNTSIANSYWVIGALRNESEAQSLRLVDFVTGFGWLVYNGKNVVSPSNSATKGLIRAPRTAVGIDSVGRLLVVVADGCEKCIFGSVGMTLLELAEFLIRQGAVFALNMDGGSSSVMALNGTVLSQPTCLDYVPLRCERPVSTVVCI